MWCATQGGINGGWVHINMCFCVVIHLLQIVNNKSIHECMTWKVLNSTSHFSMCNFQFDMYLEFPSYGGFFGCLGVVIEGVTSLCSPTQQNVYCRLSIFGNWLKWFMSQVPWMWVLKITWGCHFHFFQTCKNNNLIHLS